MEEVGEDRHGVGITHSGRGLTVAWAQRGSLEGLPGGADELLGLAVDRRLGELDELDEALEVTGRRARSAVEERAGQSGSFGQRVGVIDASEQRPDCREDVSRSVTGAPDIGLGVGQLSAAEARTLPRSVCPTRVPALVESKVQGMRR